MMMMMMMADRWLQLFRLFLSLFSLALPVRAAFLVHKLILCNYVGMGFKNVYGDCFYTHTQKKLLA